MINTSLIKDGDVILEHDKGLCPVSMAIRYLSHSYSNHGMIAYRNIYNKIMVIEATFNGVIETPFEKYANEKNSLLSIRRINPACYSNGTEYNMAISTAVNRMKSYIGKKYDFGAIVYLYAYFRYSLKAITKNPLQSREKFYCFEALAEAYNGTSSISKYPNIFAGEKFQDTATTTGRDIAKNTLFVTGYTKL